MQIKTFICIINALDFDNYQLIRTLNSILTKVYFCVYEKEINIMTIYTNIEFSANVF